MKLISIDVESDGPCPGLFSMVSFGACEVSQEAYDTKDWITYYGKTAPISDQYDLKALSISNTTREEHLEYPHPGGIMRGFKIWLNAFDDRVVMVSDNPAFDWQFINYYFHRFVGSNPLGHSARRIGDLYAGYKNNLRDHTSWKKLRETKHTHNPVDDAIGNAEALIKLTRDWK